MKKIKVSILFFVFVFCLNSCSQVPVNNVAVTYDELVTYEGIVYKTVEDKELKLDILMPTVQKFEKIPVIVYIHGGSFVSGSSRSLLSDTREHTVPQILELGYAIIAVEYTLCDGQNVFPQNIIDVKDSVRWVYKNADAYSFDINNIGAFGSSAGGLLALMIAYTNNNEFVGKDPLKIYPSAVNYVININGVTDVYDLILQYSNPIQKKYELLGSSYSVEHFSPDQMEQVENYSPLAHVNKNSVPTLIFHGTEDNTVNIEQSELLFKKLVLHGSDVNFIKIQGAEHGLTPISDDDLQMVTETTISFILENYK